MKMPSQTLEFQAGGHFLTGSGEGLTFGRHEIIIRNTTFGTLASG